MRSSTSISVESLRFGKESDESVEIAVAEQLCDGQVCSLTYIQDFELQKIRYHLYVGCLAKWVCSSGVQRRVPGVHVAARDARGHPRTAYHNQMISMK